MTRAPITWREMTAKVEAVRHILLAILAMPRVPHPVRKLLVDAVVLLDEILHRGG